MESKLPKGAVIPEAGIKPVNVAVPVGAVIPEDSLRPDFAGAAAEFWKEANKLTAAVVDDLQRIEGRKDLSDTWGYGILHPEDNFIACTIARIDAEGQPTGRPAIILSVEVRDGSCTVGVTGDAVDAPGKFTATATAFVAFKEYLSAQR